MNTTYSLTELIHPECIPQTSYTLLNSTLAQDIKITGISSDSRTVKPGDLFFAINGANCDARKLINDAFLKGAVAVLYEGTLNQTFSTLTIPVVEIRRALSFAAHIFFKRPSQQNKLNIAVTGTSGKTSVAWIIAHALHHLEEKTFLGGTLGYGTLSDSSNDRSTVRELKELGNTSIDPISVHSLLAKAITEGATSAVFEATSQGVVQYRMRDIDWNGAIFTNLSRDHLDLHETMERYEDAKRQLFLKDLAQSSKESRFAVINSDDAAGSRLIKTLANEHPSIRIYTVSISDSKSSNIRATSANHPNHGLNYLITNLISSANGTSFKLSLINGEATEDALEIANKSYIGLHNGYNLAQATLALIAAGYPPSRVRDAINSTPAVPGRLEPVTGGSASIFVDYAHKPDALSSVLNFLRPLCRGRLIVVYGCGGNRDPGKRPIMGDICYRLADLSVVTSDNPRSEDPQMIINQILSGIPDALAGSDRVVSLPDRREAIAFAIGSSKEGDIVLIAGKGHEPYQEINGVKQPFSDVAVAREFINQQGGAILFSKYGGR